MLGLLMLIAAYAPSAQAQPGPPLAVRLDFTADERCPDQKAFWQKVAARTAVRDSDSLDALKLTIVLSSDSTEAWGKLLAGDAPVTDAREVRARTCDEVADALALIATLIIERTRQEVPAPPEEPTPLPAPASPTPPRGPTARGTLVVLGAQAVAARPMTLVPLTGGGISLFVDRRLSWWLSASYSRNDWLFEARRARLGFGVVTLGVGPPSLPLGPQVRLAVAFAAEAAFLAAQGVEVDIPSSVRRSYWAVGALGRLQWQAVDRGFLFLELGGFVPLVQRRFSTRDPVELAATTTVLAPQAALGVALGL